jgi:hypothetical protein
MKELNMESAGIKQPEISSRKIEDFLLGTQQTDLNREGLKNVRFSFASFFRPSPSEKLSPLGDDKEEITQTVLGPLTSILNSLDLYPLIMEVAAIQDARKVATNSTNQTARVLQEFTSLIGTYLRSEKENLSLFNAWDSTIKRVIQQPDKGNIDIPLTPIVPNPLTYENVYFVFPLGDIARTSKELSPGFSTWKNWPEEESLDQERHEELASQGLLGSLLGPSQCSNIETNPQFYTIRRYPFSLRKPADPTLPIRNVFRGLFYYLLREEAESDSGRTTALMNLLATSWLLIVPFRRQIDFPTIDGAAYTPTDWGGEPGGCCFALVATKDSAIVDGATIKDKVVNSAIRISWLLQQAALAEGDSSHSLEREVTIRINNLLKKLPHSTYGPMSSASMYFEQLQGELESYFSSIGKAGAFTMLKANFYRAQRSISCLDYLVRLDPAVSSPQQIENISDEIRKGRTNLYASITQIVKDYKESEPKINVDLPDSSYASDLVRGSRPAWDMIVGLLLKNACEEAGTAKVVLELAPSSQQDDCLKFNIHNPTRNHIDPELLKRMEGALNNQITVFPPSGKSDGLGVGLTTIGKLIAALNLTAIVAYDYNHMRLSISLDWILKENR